MIWGVLVKKFVANVIAVESISEGRGRQEGYVLGPRSRADFCVIQPWAAPRTQYSVSIRGMLGIERCRLTCFINPVTSD